ncbi:MAG: 23S rRNA (guanosine(2251)-2'-O)-methyltransferase RlmB [Flavobacteriaceae bacterium]|nr:23S rRNA (guanosine(2251)-2'-O)-methyltransferase RlmB [Flavobacteriaceae bacterium]
MKKETLIYGIRAVIEAVEAGNSIDKVFVQRGLKGTLSHELVKLLKSKEIVFSMVPIEKLNRLTMYNHQGVVATISPIQLHNLDALLDQAPENPLFLILDQISDVRNFGAIIRTASCTGVSGIIVQASGGAPINGDVIKTSAGAVFNVPICRVSHIKDALYHLQASDIQIVAASEKATNFLYDCELSKPTALVMGSEEKGIASSVLKLCDVQAKLPMTGTIASLNVSVACGAFLYEAIRQRA